MRTVPVPRTRLDAAGLLPGCSPWSGRWMSVLDNARSHALLGMRYTPASTWLPPLVEAAQARPANGIPGYEMRPPRAGAGGGG